MGGGINDTTLDQLERWRIQPCLTTGHGRPLSRGQMGQASARTRGSSAYLRYREPQRLNREYGHRWAR